MTAPTVYNFQSGSLSAQATDVATTLDSAQFADLPAITAPDTMFLTLDPSGSAGDPELVLITAHTAAATSVTVTRAQQTTLGGGAARQHEIGVAWVAALSATDARAYIEVAEAGTGLTQRPTLNFGDGLLAADDTTQTTVSVAFDATAPAALDDSGDAGVAVVPARRDHVHPATGLVVASSFDAAGDLLIGTGADTYDGLALGTAGQVLTVNAGATAPEWATHPLRLLDNDPTDTTVSNTTTKTVLTSLDIPAGDAAAGVTYRATFIGYAVQNDAASLIYTFNAELNGTDIGPSAGFVTNSNASAQTTQYPFKAVVTVSCTSTSAQVAMFEMNPPNVGAFLQDVNPPAQAFAAMTEDMSGASTIRLLATMSVANAADSVTILHAFLERLA